MKWRTIKLKRFIGFGILFKISDNILSDDLRKNYIYLDWKVHIFNLLICGEIKLKEKSTIIENPLDI